jgi:2-oxoglutarate dehydrogenase complex dehydrogenase (E1) component-like enzyme
MGAWSFMALRLPALVPGGVSLRYAGRVPSAATATGNANVHKKELAELLADSLR